MYVLSSQQLIFCLNATFSNSLQISLLFAFVVVFSWAKYCVMLYGHNCNFIAQTLTDKLVHTYIHTYSRTCLCVCVCELLLACMHTIHGYCAHYSSSAQADIFQRHIGTSAKWMPCVATRSRPRVCLVVILLRTFSRLINTFSLQKFLNIIFYMNYDYNMRLHTYTRLWYLPQQLPLTITIT